MVRKTQQRKWIRHIFETTRRPLTPQEVLENAQNYITGLGIATVYRNLKSLHEDGWLQAVELPGQPTRYELAGLGFHHHFFCEDCSRVFDVPGHSDVGSRVPNGYKVERSQVLLYGQCSECSDVIQRRTA